MGGCMGTGGAKYGDSMAKVDVSRSGVGEAVSKDEVYILHLIYQDLA